MNTLEKILDYNKLEEITLVANTSSFLYTNFQRNQSILDLTTFLSDLQLIDLFYKEFNSEITFKKKVNLYALIIALSLKDSSHVFGFFQNLQEKSELKWSSDLASFYFSKASYTTITDINFEPIATSFDNSGAYTEAKNFEFV